MLYATRATISSGVSRGSPFIPFFRYRRSRTVRALSDTGMAPYFSRIAPAHALGGWSGSPFPPARGRLSCAAGDAGAGEVAGTFRSMWWAPSGLGGSVLPDSLCCGPLQIRIQDIVLPGGCQEKAPEFFVSCQPLLEKVFPASKTPGPFCVLAVRRRAPGSVSISANAASRDDPGPAECDPAGPAPAFPRPLPGKDPPVL